MMNVTLITVGSLKEPYLRAGCEEYIKRMRPYCKLNLIEIKEEKSTDPLSDTEIQTILEKEGQRILEKIPGNAYTVAMCIEGEMLTSEQLATHIESVGLSGKSTLVFIIGGSYGLSRRVKDNAQIRLSMSPMTFPHQLAKMLLLEQIYRAFSINNHSKYHK